MTGYASVLAYIRRKLHLVFIAFALSAVFSFLRTVDIHTASNGRSDHESASAQSLATLPLFKNQTPTVFPVQKASVTSTRFNVSDANPNFVIKLHKGENFTEIGANSVNLTWSERQNKRKKPRVHGKKKSGFITNSRWFYGDYLVNVTVASHRNGVRLQENISQLLDQSYVSLVNDKLKDTADGVSDDCDVLVSL